MMRSLARDVGRFVGGLVARVWTLVGRKRARDAGWASCDAVEREARAVGAWPTGAGAEDAMGELDETGRRVRRRLNTSATRDGDAVEASETSHDADAITCSATTTAISAPCRLAAEFDCAHVEAPAVSRFADATRSTGDAKICSASTPLTMSRDGQTRVSRDDGSALHDSFNDAARVVGSASRASVARAKRAYAKYCDAKAKRDCADDVSRVADFVPRKPVYASIEDAIRAEGDADDVRALDEDAVGRIRSAVAPCKLRLKTVIFNSRQRTTTLTGLSVRVDRGSEEAAIFVDFEIDDESFRGTRKVGRVSVDDFIVGRVPAELARSIPHDVQERWKVYDRLRRRIGARCDWRKNGAYDAFITDSAFMKKDPLFDAIENAGAKNFVHDTFDVLSGEAAVVVAYTRGRARDRHRLRGEDELAKTVLRVLTLGTGRLLDLTAAQWRVAHRFRTRRIDADVAASLERLSRKAERRKNKRRRKKRLAALPLGIFADVVRPSRARARWVLDLFAGSCLSGLEMLKAAPQRFGRRRLRVIAVDAYIFLTAHREAWENPDIIFVRADVRDIRPELLAPIGLVHSILAAPECSLFSRASASDTDVSVHDALVRCVGIVECFAATRTVLDMARYFHAPCVIENPTGDNLRSLFSHQEPFWGVRVYVTDTSYCRYGRDYQKNTTFVSNFPLVLKPVCRVTSPCDRLVDVTTYAGESGNVLRVTKRHPATISVSTLYRTSQRAVRRAEAKLHPPELIRDILRQVLTVFDSLVDDERETGDANDVTDATWLRDVLMREQDRGAYGVP